VSNYNNNCVTIYEGESSFKSFSDNPITVGKLLHVIGIPGDRGGADKNQLNGPHGVAVNSTGHILVSDSRNHCVKVFGSVESGCNFIRRIGGHGEKPGLFVSPCGIAVDASDNILVGELGGDRVQVFRGTNFLCSFGRNGDGEGEFINPRGIAIDHISGQVYVADKQNHRVHVY